MLKSFKQWINKFNLPLCSLGIEYKLFVLGLMLMPYDGIPILPFTYRPLSVFPICLSGIVFLTKHRLKISEYAFRHKYLFCFAVVAIVISTIQTLIIGGEPVRYIKFFFTGCLGLAIYLTFFELLRYCYSSIGVSKTVDSVFRIVAAAYIPALLLGLIELFSIYGIIDPKINSFLMPIFGGWQPDRIYITSREASWASVHMLIASCAYLHCLTASRKPLYIIPLVIAAFLFLMTKSMQGVLIFVTGMIVYIVWYCCTCGSLKRALLVMGLFCIFAVFGYVGLYIVMSMQPGYYYAQRFLSINSFESVINLIYQDPSSFVRLVSPIIGIGMMLSYFPVGIGGCMFSVHYPDFINTHFSWSVKYPEVFAYCSGIAEASPFCLYTRFMAEFGIFGLLFVLAIFSCVFFGLRQFVNKKNTGIFIPFVFIMLAFPLQFDSYYNVPFLLAIALAMCAEAVGRAKGEQYMMCGKQYLG